LLCGNDSLVRGLFYVCMVFAFLVKMSMFIVSICGFMCVEQPVACKGDEKQISTYDQPPGITKLTFSLASKNRGCLRHFEILLLKAKETT